jgi:uncharacterized phiE125 gp8 family phage protein
MQLAPIADVKAFLEITNASYDDLLDMLLTNISKRVESFLNRNLEKAQRTSYFNAGRKKYSLPAYPIDLTSALTVTWAGATQVKDTDYFVWEDSGMIEFLIIPTFYQPKEIVVVWTGGYANAASVPEDLQMAVIMQTAFVFRRRKDIGLVLFLCQTVPFL